MVSPFDDNMTNQEIDLNLVTKAVNGSREDLEALILRHQSWVYNIALRMVCDADDAKDITQEILIKVLTNLATYNADKASFRTWLYRIVANHVINHKKSNYKYGTLNFDDSHFSIIPDENPGNSPEERLLIQELKISCYIGSLLCFNPRDRLVFILGAMLSVPDTVGSEVMEISRVNYRKILSRSRKKLFDYMHGNCGLLDPKNQCHCTKKIKGAIRMGLLDSNKIVFHNVNVKKINEMIDHKIEEVDSFWDRKMDEFIRRFQEHPFYESDDLRKWLFSTIEKGENMLGYLH
jgi:RNA polymerase sigma factor (sigma-70 family)